MLLIPVRRLFALLCVAAGFFVCADSWHRATANTWETGPRKLAWRDAADRRLPEAPNGCARSHFGTRFVVEHRLLVPCTHGYAWLDPSIGAAKLAWYDPTYSWMTPKAFAYGPDGKWGMLFEGTRGDDLVLAIALADQERWIAIPQIVAVISREPGAHRPEVLAMRWWSGGVEAVVSRPEGTDQYGWYQAPEVVRLTANAVERRVLPFHCEYCSIVGVRPTLAGYQLEARDLAHDEMLAITEGGMPVPLTWEPYGKPGVLSDRVKIGGKRYELEQGAIVESSNRRLGSYIVEDSGDYITVDEAGHRIDPLSLRAHLGARTGRLLYAMCGLPFAIAIGLILALILRTRRLAPVAIACALYAGTAALALRTVLEVL